MENGAYALLPLLGVLALISRVRENRRKNKSESKLEEIRTPSFQIPEKIGGVILDETQQLECVWNELIKVHKESNWRFGIYESENYVETTFAISEEMQTTYRYLIYEQNLHFDVRVLDSFTTDLTTDLFVLASHFNNLLMFGKVVVDVNRGNVLFSYQNEVSLYSVFPEKIDHHISRHFHISRDVYWAFQKYLTEREEPVIIIGELLNMQRMRQENPND
jgi:hypothetical protein